MREVCNALHALELQGQMHRSEDVEVMTTDLVYTIRGMLIALPGRIAVDVATIDDVKETETTIRKEVDYILTELSQYKYDPRKYEERGRERKSGLIWMRTRNEIEFNAIAGAAHCYGRILAGR